jgi:pSer/pThr/pTyr-binding forkhead associated (FHA) protein
VIALVLWVLLFFMRFERKKGLPQLSVLETNAAHVSTKIVSLQNKETIIGGSEQANLTIAGAPAVKQKHATIIFDDKSARYTLVAEGDVTVNNKDVKQKKLEAGDVINVGGTTIVFDDGEVDEKK